MTNLFVKIVSRVFVNLEQIIYHSTKHKSLTSISKNLFCIIRNLKDLYVKIYVYFSQLNAKHTNSAMAI